jgi:transcriptional regulator with XRE-family HTH domain
MSKSIHRVEYRTLLHLLKEERLRARVTQLECSEALGRSQSFVSDVERGVRRLDLVELRDLCSIYEIDLSKFVEAFENRLLTNRGRK